MAIPSLSPEEVLPGSPARPAAPVAAAGSRLLTSIVRNRKATAGLILLGLITFVAIFPGLIAPGDPHAAIFEQQQPPSAAHLLGTTQVGEDVFTQLIWGTRITLIITVVVGLLATVIAV